MAGFQTNHTWEYLILPEREADQVRMCALGQEGWELVSCGMQSAEHVLYFKRPLPTFRDVVTLDQRRAYYASQGRRSAGPTQ